MLLLLAPRGLDRKPTQTHREFAREVSKSFSNHPSSLLISSTVQEITELFNDVRFGKQTLPLELKRQIDISLDELKHGLATETLVMEKSLVMENRAGVEPDSPSDTH